MALSGNTNYNNVLNSFSTTTGLTEEYLFEFRNQNYPNPNDPQPADTSNFIIRLATADIPHGSISDMKYHGFITNVPSIRESIDLEKSTASVSNVTISCANGTLSNHSKTLAEEIYSSSGSRNYINHQVIIYSRINTKTNQIFDGRLKEVKLKNSDTVDLVIAVQDPIENISIPEYQSKSGNYYPILYGEATPETSTVSNPDFVTDARVFPVQVDTLNNDVFNCLFHQAETSDARLHFPIKDTFNSTGYPMFVPLDDVSSNSTYDDYEGATNDTDRNVMRTDLDLERSYKIRPQTVSNPGNVAGSGNGTGLTITNVGNAYDSVGTFTNATFTFQSDASESLNANYFITDLPKEVHEITELKFSFTHQVSAFQERDGDLAITIRVLPYWNEVSSSEQVQYTNVQANTTTEFNLLSTSLFPSSLKTMPDQIQVFISFSNNPLDPGGGTADDFNTATLLMKDMFLEVTAKITQPSASDATAEKLSKNSAVTSVKKLYTGADGFDKSFSSGTVSLIHDMHRDLLHRFAGVTDTPDGYSDLNSARANWFCYYYTSKQEELKKLLEKCQEEGGFIFRFRPSNATPQYIHIPNTPNVVHTIGKNDITDLNISLTPFESLVTKRIVKFDTNPITDKPIQEITCTDTTNNPRSTYNISSKENIKTHELKILRNKAGDANMGGNKNNGFANYYNAIEGNPKLIIDTEIINPGSSGGSSYFYLMEVGDICAFDHTDMIVEPFGQSFNGKKFILTSLTRKPGSLKVSLREI